MKTTKSLKNLLITIISLAVFSSCASHTPVPELNNSQNRQTACLDINNPEKYKFDHFGVVVNNIEQSIDYYSKTFGMEFKKVHEHKLDMVLVRDETKSYTMKSAFANTGSIKIELIEITKGESIHSEFLKKNGPGIHHISYHVHDLKKEMKQAEKNEVELISYFEVLGVPVLAFYETGNGIVLEMVQENVMEIIKKARQKTDSE